MAAAVLEVGTPAPRLTRDGVIVRRAQFDDSSQSDYANWKDGTNA